MCVKTSVSKKSEEGFKVGDLITDDDSKTISIITNVITVPKPAIRVVATVLHSDTHKIGTVMNIYESAFYGYELFKGELKMEQ